MTRFVALLRGVNVGGITVKSAELRDLFDDARVRPTCARCWRAGTWPSSQRSASPAALKRAIEQALRDRFGYDAWIVLLTRAELERAVDGIPVRRR